MDKSWTVITDVEERTPYAFNDKGQWIGYDDIDSVIKKTVIVREWGLGGVMVWSVDMDDFRGLCTSQTYPLLRMIKRVLEYQPVRALLPAYPISSGFLGFPSDRDLRALPPATPSTQPPPDTVSSSINPVIIVVKARPVQATTPEAMVQAQPKSFLLHEHQHQPPSQPLLNPPRLAGQIPQFEHIPSEIGPPFPPSLMDFNGLINSRLQPNLDPGYDMAVADSNNIIQSIITSNNVVPQERALPPVPRADFPPMECPGEGFFRNPEDCTRFYRCVQALGLSWSVFHFMCPAGLVFDTNHNV
ncbi:hypothetical protein RvY_17816-3 [Ramazzottius varieornatus]|nr:hypothetical protein RvY_17816-3 [Ramazzottius varieornatus]